MPSAPVPPKIPGADFVRHIGSGGFADVFLFRQRMPARNIAVKVPRSGTRRERNGAFEREVNLMARMSAHPAVLTVFSVGRCQDGRPYLVTEYCPPPTLTTRIRTTPMDVPEVLDKGIRLAGALASLHREGIVHRDVKPGNILLTELGLPVLTDFGLAAAMSENPSLGNKGLSLPWSPPEQQRGDAVLDPTADVYSLGATLWTMLCGHSPFEIPGGDNSEAMLTLRILNSPVPRTGRDDVPEEFERLLATAMAKDPAQRFSSAVSLAKSLQQVQRDTRRNVTSFDLLEYADGGARAEVAESILVEPPLVPGGAPSQSSRLGGTRISRVLLIDEESAPEEAGRHASPESSSAHSGPLPGSGTASRSEAARRRSEKRSMTRIGAALLGGALTIGVGAGLLLGYWRSAPSPAPEQSSATASVPVRGCAPRRDWSAPSRKAACASPGIRRGSVSPAPSAEPTPRTPERRAGRGSNTCTG